MDIDNKKYSLALKFVEGVGNITFDRLILKFGSPGRVFQQSARDLMQVEGVHRKTAEGIASFKSWDRVDRELELAYKYNVDIITIHDSSYPELLRSIYDRPSLLYIKGKLISDEACIAVVGSRRASTYGKFTTENFCRELVSNGLNVVSGMARGIDTAAHRGALSGRGRTIAVLGSGLDIIYPSENMELSERIAESGAVISEFPFGTQPLASNFPARNRIISGIAIGTIVMEATEKSGSLITARFALEQGREVFAVPGSIDHPGSRGTHRLIKEGAKLVENVQDILDEIATRIKLGQTAAEVGCTEAPKPDFMDKISEPFPAGIPEKISEAVLKALAQEPLHIDAIISTTELGSNTVLDCLFRLELHGYVQQMPGMIFRKIDPMTINKN